MFTPIPLTAKQIAHIDEISTDGRAVRATLEVALNFCSNRLTEHEKEEASWWNDIAATHDLDLTKARYALGKVDGKVCVVEHKKAEEE